MASYRIEWKRSAQKELRSLPRDAIANIVSAVEGLPSAPMSTGSRKLAGADRAYRIRVGDYRVVYNVQTSTRIIEIIRVRHRKDAYRGK